MGRIKPTLVLGSLLIVGMTFWAAAQMDPTGTSMATVASRLLTTLDANQKAQATFAYDSPERLNWHFIPRERKGLPLKAMSHEQRALAFGLISSGLSRSGTIKATTIMSLEAILRDLEKGSGPVRDPELYFISIFGDPSAKGHWGWRVEGHHLSLNFTLNDGKIVAATPAFFGANPAEVRQGPREGLRTLADVEDTALRLFQALDPAQQKAALVADKAPADIPSNNGNAAGLATDPPQGEAKGTPVAGFNDLQQRLFDELLQAYTSDMPADVARSWLYDAARSQNVRFAWYGAVDRSQPHAYSVQGSHFEIEFNNTQTGANHIHSAWRSIDNDFGS